MTTPTADQYTDFVASLIKDMGSFEDNLVHATMGISGEAGELLDAVKKHWAYNKPLDYQNLIEELGDIEFYMQALRSVIGVPREVIIAANVEKLSKRYPTGTYSNAQAIARADKITTPGVFDDLPKWSQF